MERAGDAEFLSPGQESNTMNLCFVLFFLNLPSSTGFNMSSFGELLSTDGNSVQEW